MIYQILDKLDAFMFKGDDYSDQWMMIQAGIVVIVLLFVIIVVIARRINER